MTQIIEGKNIAREIEDDLRQTIRIMSTAPRLVVVVINSDHRSKQYVKLKLAKASELGLNVDVYDWSGMDFRSCVSKMKELADNKAVNGIIVQLPAPGFDNIQKLLDLIPLQKDLDCLSSASLDSIKAGTNALTPPTPRAVLELLKRSDVILKDKKILIVGQGRLVGKPLGLIMQNRGLNVFTADKNTNNLDELCKTSDVVISGAGRADLIKAEMIKQGAVIIDAGISEVGGKMTGDVNYNGMDGIASKIAKVPGGVGPVTVVCLLANLVEAAKKQI